MDAPNIVLDLEIDTCKQFWDWLCSECVHSEESAVRRGRGRAYCLQQRTSFHKRLANVEPIRTQVYRSVPFDL